MGRAGFASWHNFAASPGGHDLYRLYFPGELRPGTSCVLPARASHHAARVLRLKAGEAVTLFNGDGAEYAARISAVTAGRVVLEVGERRPIERESPLAVTLAQAVSSGERMDFTVQKAVELGVAAIEPLLSARGVVRFDETRAARRRAHWQAVALAACEQCGRNRVPQIAPPAAFDQWIATAAARFGPASRLLLSPRSETGLRALAEPACALVLLAGPEGGFTPSEEAAARRAGFTPVRLGPRLLRTETAALAALAAIQALWGDF
jgi:16S rRNA (uracil1498-N3)-methyltransferase